MIGTVHRPFVLLLLCGCDQLFELDEVPPPDAVRGDAVPECPIAYNLKAAPTPASRYRYVGTARDWRAAAADCAAHAMGRTHLAVIESEAERAAVDDMASSADVWIGLTDIRFEGRYLWVTQEPAPVAMRGEEPWAASKPDDPTGTQDCVRMNGGHAFLLDDADCEVPYHYLCECDGFANDPTQY